GAEVAIHFGSDAEGARKTLEAVQAAKVRGVTVQADLDKPEEAARLGGEAVARLGGLDILVNNAGVFEECPLDAPDAVSRLERTLRINLEAAFILSRRLAAVSAGGSIVNVSSRAGQRGESRAAAYAISKGGLNLLTISLARELAPRGIRVNAVAPGWVATEMAGESLSDPARRKQIEAETLIGRVALPQDIAHAALFLVSPLASYITGEILHVNGGSFLNRR
ncbi:MAG TPA: SDR family oxidoreductase, partial [Planctomycetota bacterium]|nr:SDR family oxidoreductase [Planctomycetota bacterium]